MALDTAQKRYSMINFVDDAMLFEVDGTVDTDDRVHLLGLYSGLTYGAPPVAASPAYRGLILNVGRLMR